MTDEQARVHFGPDEPLEYEHWRRSVRYLHAWQLYTLRQRIGPALATQRVLDVGDSDGLMLKHLGKSGLGLNLNPACVANIQRNGVEAELGDGQNLSFDDATFDCVLCFETLEHVDNPIQLLNELKRVCTPDGRIFTSIPVVPETRVRPRELDIQRGYGHVFEFSRRDFDALLTHVPLRIRWESVCDLIGPPSRLAQRTLLLANSRSHVIGGIFRRFLFFELVPC